MFSAQRGLLMYFYSHLFGALALGFVDIIYATSGAFNPLACSCFFFAYYFFRVCKNTKKKLKEKNQLY